MSRVSFLEPLVHPSDLEPLLPSDPLPSDVEQGAAAPAKAPLDVEEMPMEQKARFVRAAWKLCAFATAGTLVVLGVAAAISTACSSWWIAALECVAISVIVTSCVVACDSFHRLCRRSRRAAFSAVLSTDDGADDYEFHDGDVAPQQETKEEEEEEDEEDEEDDESKSDNDDGCVYDATITFSRSVTLRGD